MGTDGISEAEATAIAESLPANSQLRGRITTSVDSNLAIQTTPSKKRGRPPLLTPQSAEVRSAANPTPPPPPPPQPSGANGRASTPIPRTNKIPRKVTSGSVGVGVDAAVKPESGVSVKEEKKEPATRQIVRIIPYMFARLSAGSF